jgi:site-specific recombinase XerD
MRVTPHELRHSCTELYVQAGASAEDLRRLLNHKSLAATIRYMHRTDERLQRIASQVGPTPLPAAPDTESGSEAPKQRLKLVVK